MKSREQKIIDLVNDDAIVKKAMETFTKDEEQVAIEAICAFRYRLRKAICNETGLLV